MPSCADIGLAFITGLLAFAYPWSREVTYWQGARSSSSQKKLLSLEAIPKDLPAFATAKAGVNAASAGILLEQLEAQYSVVDAASKVAEGKANTILGLLGGGISLVTAFTGFKSESFHGAPVTLGVSISVFVCALFASIVCLNAGRKRGLPELKTALPYVETSTFSDGITKLYLIYAWQARVYNISSLNIRKAQWVEITQSLFLAGIVILLLSFVLTLSQSVFGLHN